MKFRTQLCSFAALLMATPLVFGACGDDGGGEDTGKSDVNFPDVLVGDGSQDGDTNTPVTVKLLAFETAFGDDQQPCKGTERCTVSLSYSDIRALKVVYTEDGVPESGQVIKFSIEGDSDSLGWVSALSAVTGDDGVAEVNTKKATSSAAQPGQFAIKAWLDKVDAPALFFDVVITPKGQVPLTVVANYNGHRPVDAFGVRLYKQNAAGVPNCDDMNDLYQEGTASTSRENVLLSQSAKFPELDGLEQDNTQTYTILAVSTNSNGAIQAWGCNAAGTVTWGQQTTVQVDMVDRPPNYVGAYEISSLFDFVSAIPEPYQTWVNYVLGFFQSPAETIFQLACDFLGDEGDTLEEVCGFLFSTNAEGELVAGAFGGALFDILNSVITGLAQGSSFNEILTAGADVADILTAFEIKATLLINEEPGSDGVWQEGDLTENWHTIRVKWSLGANCDPATEEGCGAQQYSVNAIQQQAVVGSFGGSVTDFWSLTIDQHPLSLNYGALINFLLEQVVVPLVTGEDTVNSYEELLGYLVGGGADCLTSTTLSCCGVLAGNLQSEDDMVNTTIENTALAACNTIISAGPVFLRNTLTGLDAETGDTFTLGTLNPCLLTDFNDDMVVDGIGSLGNPCQWNVELNLGNSSTSFDAVFWGARSE